MKNILICLTIATAGLLAGEHNCEDVIYDMQTTANHAAQYTAVMKHKDACQKAVNELTDKQGKNIIVWINENSAQCKSLAGEVRYFSMSCGKLQLKY